VSKLSHPNLLFQDKHIKKPYQAISLYLSITVSTKAENALTSN